MGEFIGKGCWVILLLILIYNRIKFFILFMFLGLFVLNDKIFKILKLFNNG